MKIEKKLTLTATDLDHIIDIDWFIENAHLPPSVTFSEMLINEADINGINLNEIDVVEINLNYYFEISD